MVHSGGVGECSGGHLDFDNSCAYALCIYERSTRSHSQTHWFFMSVSISLYDTVIQYESYK